MQAGHAAAVFNCQRKLRFIAADGLMLCTVIGKDALHVLHPGNQDHIAHKNCDANDALNQTTDDSIMDPTVKNTAQKCRQQEEQADRKQNAEKHRKGHNCFFQLLTAKLLLQPLFKFGWLCIGLIFRKELRRIHECFHARHHRRSKIHYAADQRPFGNTSALFKRLDLFDKALWAAHDDRTLVRPLHHNAFNQCLTADECFKFFLTDRIAFFFHANLLFFPSGDADRNKRAAALRIFQCQHSAVHGNDLLADGKSDAAAAGFRTAFIKFQLDARKFFFRNTGPIIPDADDNRSSFMCDGCVDTLALATVFGCVVKNVQKHLTHTRNVAWNLWNLLIAAVIVQTDSLLLEPVAVHKDRIFKFRQNIGRFDMECKPPVLHSREFQQFLDHTGKSLGLTRNDHNAAPRLRVQIFGCQPEMAVSGVRSSCDTEEINSVCVFSA